MYDDRRDSFSIRDIILQVLFVALFVFILLWLFPTKNFVTNYVDNSIENAVKDALDDYEFGGGINSEAFANQLFNQNVMMMKSSAKDYFTLSRLPEKKGDQVKITLKKMLDEKIILPFVDSNGKSCDVDASYVTVTKTDNEYLMKVNLKCSDYEDYLLVHMGCYDYCQTTICETQKPYEPPKGGEVNPVYEYEYKLVIDGKWGEFGEWSEWTTNIISKTDYNEVESKVENEFDKYIQVIESTSVITVDATENVKYSCPDDTYTLNGKQCIKKKDIVETINATEKINYSCPDSTYTLSGQKCYKTINNSETIPATPTTNYICPSGYVKNGTTCYRYSNNSQTMPAIVNTTYSCPDSMYVLNGSRCSKLDVVNANVTYTCPSGYKRNGTQCYKYNEEIRLANETLVCPSGYSKDGNICFTTTSIPATANSSYGDWVYSRQITVYDKALTSNNTTKYVLVGTKVNLSCNGKCQEQTINTYNVYTRRLNTSYTCPSGYSKNGTTCTKKIGQPATKKYSCPSGYKLTDDYCVKSATTTKAATANYSCPSGYTKNGSICSKSINISATPHTSSYCSVSGYSLLNSTTCVTTVQNTDTIAATPNVTYTCPSGYDRIGTNCVKNANNTYTTDAIANKTYTCPDSTYTLSGNKCYKTKSNSETISAIETKTYSCPEGYESKDNNVCSKTVTKYKEEAVYKKVTYYRSRSKSYIDGTVDYKWSRSQNDISLIKQGYKLTGKSREVK